MTADVAAAVQAASDQRSRWAERSTLPITLLVQAMATAANAAPVVAAPRLLAELAIGPVGVGLYVALVY